MKLLDISQPLRDGIPLWPGDTQFHHEPTARIWEGGSVVNVGKFVASSHTGTHVDAPFHFDANGGRVHELDLDVYVGPARVVDLSSVPGLEIVGRESLEAFDLDGVERVLIKTNCWTDRSVFPREITHLTPEAAEYLGDAGARLVGVDVPSVDDIESKELPTHHALHARNIHILEGLVLDDVDAGDYELIALPLPLRDADGSPVRAALRPL